MTTSTNHGTEPVLAACHVHSEWSYDGTWPLPGLAAEFSARGYRALLMTEHDRGFTPGRLERYRAACAAASTDRLLVVPGIEYSDADNVVHILTWGDIPFLGEGRPTAALLADVTAAKGIAVLAHPSRRNAWQRFTPEWSRHLQGIEVWNRKTDGWAPSRTAAPLLGHGALLPFVGMDFHDHRQMFPLAMDLPAAGALNANDLLLAVRLRQCRPVAFGRPLEKMTRGWLGGALRSLEGCRRTAASTCRRWRVQRAA